MSSFQMFPVFWSPLYLAWVGDEELFENAQSCFISFLVFFFCLVHRCLITIQIVWSNGPQMSNCYLNTSVEEEGPLPSPGYGVQPRYDTEKSICFWYNILKQFDFIVGI